jgi:MFS family permease
MIQKILKRFLRKTHVWRHVGFAELAELYISRMLRVLAMQLMIGFTTIYLYQLGYSLLFIILAWLAYFIIRFLYTPLVAITIARYGPKHGTLISNITLIIGTMGIILVPQYGTASLLLYLIFASYSRSLYDVCYLVEFSKVKHIHHAGKEIGFMQIVERVMGIASPIIGGLIALWFGPQAMLVFGAFLMVIAAAPLFFTAEPVKVQQRITLRHFNVRSTYRAMIANIGIGVDNNLTGVVWNTFVGIIILNGQNNAVYLQLGGLMSVSVIASMVAAYWYGKLVDRYHGKALLYTGTIGNTLLHMLRPFIGSPLQVGGANVMNEAVTTAYTLPATRSIFEVADGLPGYRIVFMAVMSGTMVLGDIIVMAVLALFLLVYDDKTAMQYTFWVLGPAILLISLHAHTLYKRGIFTRFIHRV